MKKCLSMFLALTIVFCLFSVGIPSVSAAENDDNYYYYSVKVTVKVEGDALTEEYKDHFSLHGVELDRTNTVLEPYTADGKRVNYTTVDLQPGDTEHTGVFVYRSERPLIGVRFIDEESELEGLTFKTYQYYYEFPTQTPPQQTGLENAMSFEKLQLIEGFGDGGTLILSELRDIVFTLNYNAPPVFSGAEDGGEYFTTQTVKVKDADLVSVMLDDKAVEIENGEALVTIPGDTDKTYTITAKDAVRTVQMTVTMHKFSGLAESVSDINEKNVKPEQKPAIQEAISKIEAVIEKEPNAPAEEKNRLEAMKKELEDLLSRIDEAAAYKNTDNVKKTEGITADNVKISDKEALEKAASDLKKALDEYGGNYKDSEKEALQKELTRVNAALEAIEKMSLISPETGDTSPLALWITLFILSAAAIVVIKRKIA